MPEPRVDPEQIRAEARAFAQYGAAGVTQTLSPWEREERLARIEAKLDRLMQALSAGAVGDWR
jgi:hypothetical protein